MPSLAGMKRFAVWMTGMAAWGSLTFADPLFVQDFTKSEVGTMPDEFLILDGQFAVKEDAGNRFVELPGAPLESYGFLFGPNSPHGVEISGRIWSTKSGRKFPTFGLGANGASGYRIQVAPAKGMIELLRGDVIVASTPFAWKSGEWTELRLRVIQMGEGAGTVEGSAWSAGAEAPKEPMLRFTESKIQPAGKASAWGMPFAGTPIRFDDLKVTPLAK